MAGPERVRRHVDDPDDHRELVVELVRDATRQALQRPGPRCQLTVGGLQLPGSAVQVLVEVSHARFGVMAISDVGVELDDRNRPPVGIALERLTAGDHDHPAVLAGMAQLTHPMTIAIQCLINSPKRPGEHGAQQIVDDPSHGLV
ncbi:MAG: hypothetical protein ABSH51_13000 [Solirubrobacteraceae bacterium]|jgi:hypothetical protein